jgi:hypothetical protein
MFTTGLVLLIVGLVVSFLAFVMAAKGFIDMFNGKIDFGQLFVGHIMKIIAMGFGGLLASIGLILFIISFFV